MKRGNYPHTYEKKLPGGRRTFWRVRRENGRWVTVEISHDEWNHSDCQSACIRRGAEKCVW